MCIVSISHRDYLMPSDKGMKLVELMQHAIECDWDFTGNIHAYIVREQPETRYKSVKPSEIKIPQEFPAPSSKPMKLLLEP